MMMHSADATRRAFLDYFRDRDHVEVPGIPLVPPEDPTLLFTSAGMVPFKNFWAGSGELPYRRAVSVQRCLRAGGKDSDLENVGRDARHHTLFEMLGNFSFGDYFKEESIVMAWEFLTGHLALDRRRLLVSVFESDDEAAAIWGRIVDGEKIFRLGAADNFWGPAGETGVCGPSSEIYFDRGDGTGCGRAACRPGCDCDRFLEVWNLVFPQFNKDRDGKLQPLSRPGIDTGMGLERISAVLQGAASNFETDLFRPLTAALEGMTGLRYDPAAPAAKTTVAFRVAADHARALTFAVAENILPANDGRGYVIRRILRRAVRFLHAAGVDRPVLGRLVPEVVAVMSGFYPLLAGRADFVAETVTAEETRYLELLGEGRRVFLGFAGQYRERTVPGEIAFRLYDTYGLPLDLTRELAAAEGYRVDEAGYRAELERSRAASRGGGDGVLPADRGRLVGLAPTAFRGYDCLECDTVVEAVLPGAPAAGDGRTGHSLVLAATPFYAERGGQAGDRGLISGDDFEFAVSDTRVDESGFTHHLGAFTRGLAERGARARARVDAAARRAAASNHTATHLLHEALRRALGPEVKQAGSLVTPEQLRFDFLFSGAVPGGLAAELEATVNAAVRESLPLAIEEKPLEAAVADGALALFTEKYGKSVRVVSVGSFSREVCGGTHLENTGQVGLFVITGLASIGKGVRRVEALTGEAARRWVGVRCDYLEQLARTLKVEPLAVGEEISRREAEQARLAGRAALFRPAWLREETARILKAAGPAGPVRLAVAREAVLEPDEARQLLDMLRGAGPGHVFLLATGAEGAVRFLLGVAPDLVSAGWNARALLKETAGRLGGGAGGRADFAQAGFGGAVDPGQVADALRAVIAAREDDGNRG